MEYLIIRGNVLICATTQLNFDNIMLSKKKKKKLDAKGHTLYDSIYMKFPDRKTSRQRQKVN